ncbi:MAG: NAD(P)-binding domain-containing protein [Planctomycetaceae bacterium]
MSWTLLVALVLALGILLGAALARRAELARMRRALADRERAVRQGSAAAQLLHPVVDLSRCLGCATCVAVCPEEGVLELVHGQAMVVNGARCVGHAVCEGECPVGAITVTLGDAAGRTDLPALTEGLEAVGSPGLFLAGEVTAAALIKSAIEQGVAVAAEVARRAGADGASTNGTLDLCIVGSGPAGLACSLEAKRLGLRFVTLDQEQGVGGTVAKYPRRKLVLTQPVDLPLHGRLARTTYTKEELVTLWRDIAARHRLPIEAGETVTALHRDAEGAYAVETAARHWKARHVCLALGRRGAPRRLGVPGEDLAKVATSLLDAHSYRDRRLLVVGGGDSAVETALALAEQPGNEVTLSYRKESFFRIRSRNEQRLKEAVAQKRLEVLFGSEVRAIRPEEVELVFTAGPEPRTRTIANDEVFVMAGGVPPMELLARAGVSFDPALRTAPPLPGERGTGILPALAAGFATALVALAWALAHRDYYGLAAALRPAHDKHPMLRPGRGVGLALGIAAGAMILLNLLYLARRSPRLRFRLGSLRLWMTSHVATGILALVCALLHGAMAPRDTPGGHALTALLVLFVTGAIGRYLYAYVPRAANGRELELAEVKARLARLSDGREEERFGVHAMAEVAQLTEARQWRGSFLGRVLGLLTGQRALRRMLARLAAAGRKEGVPEGRIRRTLHLAREAHKAALAAAHYEDLRAVLGSWRYLHRWIALLMVLLVALHVAHALLYGFASGGTP